MVIIVDAIYLFHSMTVLKRPTWDTQGGVEMNSCINCVLEKLKNIFPLDQGHCTRPPIQSGRRHLC